MSRRYDAAEWAVIIAAVIAILLVLRTIVDGGLLGR
jgi:hypothetical protein